MSIYLMDPVSLETVFEFDCEIDESRYLQVNWTEKPIEAGYDITLGGHAKPEDIQVSGFMTAWPIDIGEQPANVIQADDKLRQLAIKREPVTVVTAWWSEKALITKVDGSSSLTEGDALRMSIALRTYSEITPEYTQIPPSRLRPAVKKRAAPKAKKKTTTGKTPSSKVATKKSWAAAAVDALGIKIPVR